MLLAEPYEKFAHEFRGIDGSLFLGAQLSWQTLEQRFVQFRFVEFFRWEPQFAVADFQKCAQHMGHGFFALAGFFPPTGV